MSVRRMSPRLFFVLAVCWFALSSIAEPKKATHPVTIDDMRYSPATLQINTGDSVEWTNNDVREHTVSGKGFSSGKLKSGQSYRFTFKKAGRFDYGCDLHPRMKGAITVIDP